MILIEERAAVGESEVRYNGQIGVDGCIRSEFFSAMWIHITNGVSKNSKGHVELCKFKGLGKSRITIL